jgi:uncharacterized protein YjbI with pentapeptide repeats
MSAEDSPEQEKEVRRTAQRVIATHLRPGEDPEHPTDTFWPGIDLELTCADLRLFDLKGAWLRNGWFGGAKFDGPTWFDGARFDGSAIFGGARFEKFTSFEAVRFGAEARFRGAKFQGPVTFTDAVFDGDAFFARTGSELPSDSAVFEDTVTFTGARFARPPVVEGSVELD